MSPFKKKNGRDSGTGYAESMRVIACGAVPRHSEGSTEAGVGAKGGPRGRDVASNTGCKALLCKSLFFSRAVLGAVTGCEGLDGSRSAHGCQGPRQHSGSAILPKADWLPSALTTGSQFNGPIGAR